MAVITSGELAKIRRGACRGISPDFDKGTIDDALQAIEDWFESVKASGATAINTATAPYVFSGPMKKKLFAYWLNHKFLKEME